MNTSIENMNDVEAAKFVGLGVQTMRNRRFQGKAPVYSKLGRRVVYQKADLIDFLEENKVEPQN